MTSYYDDPDFAAEYRRRDEDALDAALREREETRARTRPIGVADLGGNYVQGATYDHWYWCRRHERAERVGEPQVASDGTLCIRAGPFMSEHEANRLGGRQRGRNMDLDSDFAPLGMIVE